MTDSPPRMSFEMDSLMDKQWHQLSHDDQAKVVGMLQTHRDTNNNFGETNTETWLKVVAERRAAGVSSVEFERQMAKIRDTLRLNTDAIAALSQKDAQVKRVLARVEQALLPLERAAAVAEENKDMTVKVVQAALSTIDQRLGPLDGDIATISNRLSALGQMLDMMRTAGQALSADVVRTRTTVETDSTNILSLISQVSALRGAVESARSYAGQDFVFLAKSMTEMGKKVHALTLPPPPPTTTRKRRRGEREVEELVKGMLSADNTRVTRSRHNS